MDGEHFDQDKHLQAAYWPVGQGLFTHLDLEIGEQLQFRMVYDCGKLHPGRGGVVPYSDRLGNRPLDLLVLSHFDGDHVSGVAALLKITGGAQAAWVPELAPELRVLNAVQAVISAARAEPTPAEVDAVGMALAPVPWLHGHGVDVVYELAGPSEEGGVPPSRPRVWGRPLTGDDLPDASQVALNEPVPARDDFAPDSGFLS